MAYKVGPVDVVSIIKSLVCYYPLRSIAQMDQGCGAHTSHLIAKGIAAPE